MKKKKNMFESLETTFDHKIKPYLNQIAWIIL